MRHKRAPWLARLAVVALGAVVLGACTVPGSDSEKKSPEESSVDAPVNAALASACRPDGQRVEGEDGMAQYSQPFAMAIDPSKTYTAEVVTNFGAFTVEFYPEDAPNTVNNFICLANDGYYTNTPFHRIISGFVIQGGDPTGTGAGGPGYRFNDEPIARDYLKGTLAMANAGPNTNGSQFFVVLDNLTGRLPKNYTVFGMVTDGIDVVDKIAKVQVGRSPSGEMSSPTEPVTLESVTVTEK